MAATCSLPELGRAATSVRQSSGMPQPSQPSSTSRGPGKLSEAAAVLVAALVPSPSSSGKGRGCVSSKAVTRGAAPGSGGVGCVSTVVRGVQ